MKKQSHGKKKIILGLTGSFGSGKSTVAAMFKSYGAVIIDADKIAHELVRPGSKVYKRIVNVFDEGVLRADKSVDRGKLGKVVFADKKLLKKLNSIMHPEIIRVIKQKINSAPDKIVILDAPLLIEAGLDKIVDKLIVVKITQKEQVKRICRKAGLTRPNILKRIKAQIPLRDKVRLADFVIDNAKTIEKTKEQVKQIRRLLWRN